MIALNEIHENVAKRACECPFCGYDPDSSDVHTVSSDEYDEEYHGIECPECSAQYEDDRREWYELTAPGVETSRVQV